MPRDLIRQVRKWGSPGWSHRESYEGLHLAALIHRARLRMILRVVASLPVGDRGALADFGCSDGYILSIVYRKFFEDKNWSMHGFDANRELLKKASSGNDDNFHFEFINLNEENSLHNNEFDIVLCLETVEHTGNYENAVLNVVRACKSGGYVLMTAPHEVGWRGLVKFYGRKVLQKDPYGDFFKGASEWSYVKVLLAGGSVEEFRKPDRQGWGPHLGFDILAFEKFIGSRLIDPGEYRLIDTSNSFFGFNRLYLMQRI